MAAKKAFSACVLIVAVTAARADATTVTYHGFGLHENVTINRFGQTLPSTAGQLNITYDGRSGAAYCVDIEHSITSPWEARILNHSVLNFGRPAGWLFDMFAGGVTTSVQAAGLQIAIWEVLDDFDRGINLSTGVFRLVDPGNVRTAAEAYLAAIPPNVRTYTPNAFVLYSGENPRSQHLMVPEPATLVLMGLAPVLALLRRRRLA